jgi:integrase/recombinase XerD
MWTLEDDLLFPKYCPSARERYYHIISRDLSCRPHEILKLRLKDIHFKNSREYQYGEVLLNGKTGNRNIPLISSIPYLKDWIDQHPQAGHIYQCDRLKNLKNPANGIKNMIGKKNK